MFYDVLTWGLETGARNHMLYEDEAQPSRVEPRGGRHRQAHPSVPSVSERDLERFRGGEVKGGAVLHALTGDGGEGYGALFHTSRR